MKLINLAYVVLLVTIIAIPAMAQVNQKTESGTREASYPVPLSQIFRLVRLQNVSNELELSDSQRIELQALTRKHNNEISKLNGSEALNDFSPEGLRTFPERRHRMVAGIDESIAVELDEILLPFQQKRISEIGLQSVVCKPCFVSSYYSDLVRERAGLNDKEYSQISEIAQKAEKEYLVELKQLQLRFHERIRESAGQAVSKKLHEVLGSPIVLESSKDSK